MFPAGIEPTITA